MLKKSIWESFSPSNLLFQIIVGLACGLLFGMAFLLFSPLLVLGVLAAVILLFVILKWPEIGLLGILIATSSIVFEDQLPALTAGGVSLQIPDLILLLLLGVIVIRSLVDRNFKIVRTPLDWPLLIFIGVALLSTFIAIFQSSVDPVDARRVIRMVIYYLTFFIVTNLIRQKSQLRLLLRGLFILAIIVDLVMMAQFVVGDSVQLLPGSITTLETSGEEFAGTTRIVTSGRSVVLVSFITLTAILCVAKFRPKSIWDVSQWILSGLALILTFLRSYWAATGIVLFIMIYLSWKEVKLKLIGFGIMAIALAIIIFAVSIEIPDSRVTKLVSGSYARLATLGSTKTLQEGSLQWRYVENEYALSQIMAHPVLGIGLGARYRPFDPRIDYYGLGDFRNFIHNGHLWVLMDTGLLGYLSLMCLSLFFLIRGFKYWRNIADARMRGIVLGFTLVYLAVLIAGVVNSDLVQSRWTPVIGILMGVNEVILAKFGEKEPINPTDISLLN